LTFFHFSLSYLIFTGTSVQVGPQPESYLFDFPSLAFNLPYFYRNFSSGWTEFQKFLIHDLKNKKKMLNLYVREGTTIQAFHIFDLGLPALGISIPKGLNSRTFSYTERRKLGLIIF
jgi:hypothetical protein